MSLEFGVEAVGEEGVGEGSVEGVNGEGEVSGEGFEAVVGEGGTFAAREGQEVTGGVGGGRQPVAGASGAQEGEVEGDIIADKQVFANKGKEVGESLLGRPSFVGEGGVVKADEGGDVVREGGGLADKGGEGLGGLAVLDLDGAVLDDVGDGGVEPGGFEVDGDVVPAVACACLAWARWATRRCAALLKPGRSASPSASAVGRGRRMRVMPSRSTGFHDVLWTRKARRCSPSVE